MVVIVPEGQTETVVNVSLDGVPLGEMRIAGPGRQTGTLPLKEPQERQVRVELDIPPAFRPATSDPRGLGVAIVSFGFVERR